MDSKKHGETSKNPDRRIEVDCQALIEQSRDPVAGSITPHLLSHSRRCSIHLSRLAEWSSQLGTSDYRGKKKKKHAEARQ